MTTFQLIQSYSYVGDIITVLTCITLVAIIGEALYFSEDKNFQILKKCVFLILFASMSNICFGLTCQYEPEAILYIFLFRDIYHVLILCALFLYICYLRNLLDLPKRIHIGLTHLSRTVFFLGIIFDVISPLTHFGFYYDNGIWHDSTYIKPYTLVYIYALAAMGYVLIVYGERMIKSLRNALIILELICVIVDITENSVDSNTYATFTFTIPIIAMLVLLHSMPFDLVTGAMNADAYKRYLNHHDHMNMNLDYMILELSLDNFTDLPVALGKALHTFWNRTFHNATLFNLHSNIYVLVIERKNNTSDSESKIQYLVNDIFPEYYSKFKIDYKSVILYDTDYIKSIDDMDRLLSYFLSRCEKNSFLFPDEKQVEDYKKSLYIAEQLADIVAKKDLNDERVLVYCQPVKNVATGEFDTGEILMRMKLKERGMIFPDQFIPLAESCGYIHALSLIILNKTCKTLKQMLADGYNITRISVNFAISELHDTNFCDEILDIISANGVPYDKIALELTESQNEEDFNIVFSSVERLKEYGMKFYLDDFGTGYSNLERILRLNLDVIKFDRSLLLYADDDNNGLYTLKHFAEMFEGLNYKILFEGVETDAHEELCVDSHADYLQGFKYSKPIPFEETKSFFKK